MLWFVFAAHSTCLGRPKRLRDANFLPYLPECKLLFFENFSDPGVRERWISSKDPRYQGKWKSEPLIQLQGRRGERGLVLKSGNFAAAIGHQFRHPLQVTNETLVIQYEFRAQFLFMCGSGYMRLYTTPTFDPKSLSNDTLPFIEFGPERCRRFNQSRFVIYRSDEGPPVPHELKRPHYIPPDEIVHLFTLILRPDGTFETLIDNRGTRNGTFAADFTPPLFETATIDDPTDQQPSDWDDRVLIPDLAEPRPKDWDDNAPAQIPDPRRRTPPPNWLPNEPATIPEPNARKPADWDDDKMGEWHPRQVANPKCVKVPGCGEYKVPHIRNPKARGIWRPHLIPNPAYKGEWRPRQIPNPNFHGRPFTFEIPPIVGIGFDVWTSDSDFAFTNIAIGTDEEAIRKWNSEDFAVRQRMQIRKMKIAYSWIQTDLPDDQPEGGLLGYPAYWSRCLQRRWRGVRHKHAVIGISLLILLVLIPVILICWQLCRTEPFEKIKDE
jgi:calnexin